MIFISPQKTGTTSIGGALNLCGFDGGGWEPNIFTLEEYSYIIFANRLIGTFNSCEEIPRDVRIYLYRKFSFFREAAATKDFWEDWPIAHECLDPLLKKIAVPHAKFIFCLRNIEKWIQSMAAHYETPSHANHHSFRSYWCKQYALWLKRVLILKKSFPQDVLLYDVQSGWEPLCNFLGIPAPSEPFPKLNVRKDRR